MINMDKVINFCKPFRIILGVILIAYALYSGNYWFYLGVIPLVAGIFGICPMCKITKQCNIFGKKNT